MSADAPRTTTGQPLYVTHRDYLHDVVLPSLGAEADAHDTDAIASEMLIRIEHIGRDGLVDTNHSGYAPRTDIDFWEVVASHQITEEDL